MKNTELLIYMLEDIRKVTLSGVKGLTKEQLFKEPLPGEYSIGSYLMHLAEAELYWLEILSGIKQPDELKKRAYSDVWFDAMEGRSNPPQQSIEPEEYIAVLADTRKLLVDYIRIMTDEDLETTLKIKRSATVEVEITKKWIIYHLIEHEAHTRGQMFLLMRMGGLKKKGENN